MFVYAANCEADIIQYSQGKTWHITKLKSGIILAYFRS